jgi:CRISPR/Cas system-associated exonuclease Cas4 (RecB family)
LLKEDLNMIDKFLPILVEKEYTKNVNGVPLHGFIDAGFEDTQRWLFDWKTNKQPKISEAYIKQATRYAILTEGEFETDINEFFIINLRRKIDLSKCRVEITPQMKDEQREELRAIWEVMNGDEFPKKPGNCFFCEYKMRCKAYPDFGVSLTPSAVEIASGGLLDAPTPTCERIIEPSPERVESWRADQVPAIEPTVEIPKFEAPKPIGANMGMESSIDEWL